MPPAVRPHRLTLYYHRLRAEVYRLLGDSCALCGSTYRLSVDHVHGRSYDLHTLSSHQRMRRYLAEIRAGKKLRLLCGEHSVSSGRDKEHVRGKAGRWMGRKELAKMPPKARGIRG